FMLTGFRTVLPDRGVLALTGEDRYGFLQGLVSNDVERARGDRAVYAALLTAQGRFLHDFFLVRSGDALLLDCEAERRDDLRVRLSRYRLRAKVAVEDRTETLAVGVVAGPDAAARMGLPVGAGGAEASGA